MRFFGGQANGCGPIATAFESGTDIVRPVEKPDTIVRSLSIGSPADGGYAIKQARDSDAAILGVADEATIDSIRLLAETEGILTETAGGVTLAALRRAIDEGRMRRDEETVLVITGNGLKTLDVLAADDAATLAGAHRPQLRCLRGVVGRAPPSEAAA